MNKRFLTALLTGAFFIASASMFVACKDYDDDINDLQAQIDKNAQAIKDLQALIQNGAVIKSVDQITGGVRVTLSNDKSFDILNGKDGAAGADGKDGDVWTIGDDGFWYKNGSKTDYYALGKDGKDGKDGVDGKDGKDGVDGKDGKDGVDGVDGKDGKDGTNADGSSRYYVPNPSTGTFWVYNDGDKDPYDSGISFIVESPDTPHPATITAVYDTQSKLLTLFGVPGGEGDLQVVTISLSGTLGALVFVPQLYLDGIEGIEYPWIGGYFLKDKFIKKHWDDLSHHGIDGTVATAQDIEFNDAHAFDYLPNTLGRYYDEVAKEIKEGFDYAGNKRTLTNADEWIYGPAWAVQYHMNPSTAIADYSKNDPKFNVLEPDVIYYNTRASEASLNVTSPKEFFFKQTPERVTSSAYNNRFYGIYGKLPASEYGVWGLWNAKNGVFNTSKEGVLSAAIQIEHPDRLAPWPTDDTINPNGNTDSDVSYPAPTTAPASDAYPAVAPYGDAYGVASWYGFARYKYNKNNTDNTVALQLTNDEDGLITSDYALIVPTRVQLEGLIWYKKPQYIEPDMPNYNYGPNKTTPNTRIGDEEGWASDEYMNCNENRIHIWDSPQEALNDPDGAALELYCEDAAGVDLTQYLGIHFVKENLKHKETAPGVFNEKVYDIGTWAYGDEAAFDLHYEFQLVDYYSSTNQTHDSRYASFSDTQLNAAKDQLISRSGIILPKSVDANGNTIDVRSTSAVDREPLVRIMVKNSAGKVLLDGYILLHINFTPDNLNVTTYPEYEATFNLCDPIRFETTWAQFSKLILQDALEGRFGTDSQGVQLGMEKITFDDYYWADCQDGTVAVNPNDAAYVTTNAFEVNDPGQIDSHQRGYQLKIYNFGNLWGNDASGNVALPPVKGGADAETALAGFQDKELGNAVYYPNGEGTTNHIFAWTLTEEELEYLTHDLANDDPVKITRWIRFIAKDEKRNRDVNNFSAPYPYIWVKMTMSITRDNTTISWKDKIDNYWNHWKTGNASGWSGILFDIQAPRDDYYADPFNRYIPTTLLTNTLTLSKNLNYKYYFAPKNEVLEFYTLTRTSDANTLISDAINASPYVTAGTNVVQTVKSVLEGFEDLPAAVQSAMLAKGLVKKEKRVITAVNSDVYNAYTNASDVTTRFVTSAYPDVVENYKVATNLKYDEMYCKYVYPHTYVNQMEENSEWWNTPKPNTHVLYKKDPVTITKAQDTHKWVEASLKDLMHRCAIDYNKGVFRNNRLYSFNPDTKKYILIATLNQATGEIDLVKNDPVAFEEAKLVLNAYGYEPNRADIYKQLRTWVGVVSDNGCGVAYYTYPEKTDDNLNTFLVSWERPINTTAEPIAPKLDANTNENWIHLIDYLKLYDWRGNPEFTNQGYMFNDHYWFWSYYMIKSITLDMRTDRIFTNLHFAPDWVTLNQVSSLVDLYAYSDAFPTLLHNDLAVYHFDLTGYNRADRETAIETFMGNPSLTNPSTKFNNRKQRFSAIYYQNNGDVVDEFDVYIPYTIEYEWGWLSRIADFKINTTHGN